MNNGISPRRDNTLWGETWTNESKQQSNIIDAFLEYVTAGAVYAKHIKSTSVRLWAHLMDKLQQLQSRTHKWCDAEDVEELLKFEKLAANRLRQDMIIEKLPAFRKIRAKGRR